MKSIVLILDDIKAKGKGRPRFTTRGRYVRTYTPSDTQHYCNIVRDKFIEKYGNEYKNYTGAVRVNILVCYAPPKSLSEKKKRELWNKPYLKKPDNDNLEKSIFDALNGVAYVDDSQICDNKTRKIYNKDDFVYIDIMYEDL